MYPVRSLEHRDRHIYASAPGSLCVKILYTLSYLVLDSERSVVKCSGFTVIYFFLSILLTEF